MIVTGVLVMSVSDAVYRGVGSPNVWHNPTQQTVTTAMMTLDRVFRALLVRV